MRDRQRIKIHGIIVTAVRRGGVWNTYFENEPGNFEQLHNVEPLRDCVSVEVALAAGRQFVEDHLWKSVEEIGIFTLKVRLWWGGKWGYGVWCDGITENSGACYASQADAIAAGRACAIEMIAELDRRIAEDDARIAARRAELGRVSDPAKPQG